MCMQNIHVQVAADRLIDVNSESSGPLRGEETTREASLRGSFGYHGRSSYGPRGISLLQLTGL